MQITARGDALTVNGPPHKVRHVSALLEEMVSCLQRGEPVDLLASFEREAPSEGRPESPDSEGTVLVTKRNLIRPRTEGQRTYTEAIDAFDIVFAIGPAGTGKTYLSVACAVAELKRKEVSRIVLTRPAVEAGESLGFLPGNIQDKVDPYLRPLYDALRDMIPADRLRHLVELRTVEIAPLAFMRGRTLNDAFVILDEAQNTTIGQMKMFLTRLGANSKAVVTGDITQVDLPPDTPSGLVHIQHILSHIEAIRFVYLTERDVVRHRLVQEIINAYSEHGQAASQPNATHPHHVTNPDDINP
ncbi:MAG: PhoH family protein [Candidatus Latescibacteria bacterium]|nr:PhoH family protein [Candidatus Latescibacterota bacterium]